MKKAIITLGALIVASFAFTSCNKDYNCVCRLNGVEVSKKSIREATKNKAEDKCNEMQSTFGITHQCKIE
jgi:hypothetical protein